MPASSQKKYTLLLIAKAFFTVLLLNVFFCFSAAAQADNGFDEVPVYLNVQNIDNTEINALVKDETAYLPIQDIFDFLKIVNKPSAGRDSLSGFFITENALYVIDKSKNSITYQNKTYELKPGSIIKMAGVLYLASDYFGKVFGLNCQFSFRNLTVMVNTLLELPVMREMRISQSRANSMQLNTRSIADTVVKRTYPLFHFGMADWSVIHTTESYLGSNTRIYTALGANIAGGETNVSLNYNTAGGLNEQDQFYSWRLANNDNTAVRQIVVGKIFAQSISSIYSSIIGFTVTNTPTTFRRAFGTYTLTDTTYPNWIVELYVNNVLVSFVRTDAAGLYTFQVPLVYGTSQVKLRFYGPSGEERYTETNINIPYNFLPRHEFEYTATNGVVDDSLRSRFSRLAVAYGLNDKVTVGGGTEYLSSVKNGGVIPFVTSSARVFKNLLLSGEYDYNVRTRAVATYNLLSGLQVELNDTWYKRGQTAIINTFLEERKATVSVPLRSNSFAAFTRVTIDQIKIPGSSYTTGEWLVSAARGNYVFSVNTYGVFISQNTPYIYSNFALTATLFKRYLFTQQVQFDYRGKQLVSFKDQVERHFFRSGYINLSFENNLYSHLPTVELGLRYDFSFGQAGASIRKNKAYTRYTQSANGSIIVDRQTKYTGFANYTNVAKGGMTIVAFIDLNENGKKDPGEPKAQGVKIKVNGGRVQQDLKDTLLRVTDLEPYVNYAVEIDPLSFENIAWRVRKHNFSVAIDPNFIKTVNVPVIVASEVSGHVSFKDDNEERRLSRFIIGFYDAKTGHLAARTTTEQDGYFTYMGLPSGNYIVRLDADQLKELNLAVAPGDIKVYLKRSVDGTIADGLEFVLQDAVKEVKQKE